MFGLSKKRKAEIHAKAKENTDRFDKEMQKQFLRVQKTCSEFSKPIALDKFTWELCSYVAVMAWEKTMEER
jgi:hypothetical protein